MPYVINLLESRHERPGGTIVPSRDVDRHAESSKLEPAFAAHGLCDRRNGDILICRFLSILIHDDPFQVLAERCCGGCLLLVDSVAERYSRGPVRSFGHSGNHHTVGAGAYHGLGL